MAYLLSHVPVGRGKDQVGWFSPYRTAHEERSINPEAYCDIFDRLAREAYRPLYSRMKLGETRGEVWNFVSRLIMPELTGQPVELPSVTLAVASLGRLMKYVRLAIFTSTAAESSSNTLTWTTLLALAGAG